MEAPPLRSSVDGAVQGAVAVAKAIAQSSPPPSPLSEAAIETVKRRGRQLSSELQEFVSGLSTRQSLQVQVPLELKVLGALIVLFLFLLFLIFVLWDRFGKEIGELYTPKVAVVTGERNDVNPNAVAPEYTVYQKLPTFFYEYTAKKKRQ